MSEISLLFSFTHAFFDLIENFLFFLLQINNSIFVSYKSVLYAHCYSFHVFRSSAGEFHRGTRWLGVRELAGGLSSFSVCHRGGVVGSDGVLDNESQAPPALQSQWI